MLGDNKTIKNDMTNMSKTFGEFYKNKDQEIKYGVFHVKQ